MRRVHFFQLSRPMQERFIASAKGTAPPAPILRQLGTTRIHLVFAAVAGVAFLVLLGVVFLGFGGLGSGASVQPLALVVLYVALVFLIPFGILRAIGLRLEAKALPFAPGIYVFPMCIVDARQKAMRVAPMTDLVSMQPGNPFRLAYKGIGQVELAPSGEPPEQIKFQFEVAQENAKHALATKDEAELVTLDPFYEPKKFVSPIGPQEPLVERVPSWAKLGWAIALGLGVVLGPLAYFVRNSASDDRTLQRAKEQATPEAFRAYLEHGRRHTEEVADVLLPRAELDVAKKQSTVEAVQAFIAAHPGSKIDGEAQAALRDAYVAELEKAKAKGTVTALEEFAKKYPQHHLEPELSQARHALYVAALAKYKKSAPGLSIELVGFVDKLFAHLEAKGPRVSVVFRREISPNLERADKLIGASPLNKTLGGRQVTKYFDGKANPKEAELVKALAAALGKIVPADILRVEAGPEPGEKPDDALLQETKAPLLVVHYKIGWLGVAFSSNALKRAFAGIHVNGDATFLLPNDARLMRVKVEVFPPPTLITKFESKDHPAMSTEPANEAEPEVGVYGALEARALETFATQIERLLLPPAR